MNCASWSNNEQYSSLEHELYRLYSIYMKEKKKKKKTEILEKSSDCTYLQKSSGAES